MCRNAQNKLEFNYKNIFAIDSFNFRSNNNKCGPNQSKNGLNTLVFQIFLSEVQRLDTISCFESTAKCTGILKSAHPGYFVNGFFGKLYQVLGTLKPYMG
jgi:hypothetical protein